MNILGNGSGRWSLRGRRTAGRGRRGAAEQRLGHPYSSRGRGSVTAARVVGGRPGQQGVDRRPEV